MREIGGRGVLLPAHGELPAKLFHTRYKSPLCVLFLMRLGSIVSRYRHNTVPFVEKYVCD